MYLGIDIGGTKTLAAVLDDDAVITERNKFPTPADYDEFLRQLAAVVGSFETQDWKAAGVGMPVTTFNRELGIGINFSNLPWQNVAMQDDLEKLLKCPVYLENDAKLAGLSESMMNKQYHKVLYVTVSTGIGTALVVDNKIDDAVGDGGGRTIMLEFQGKLRPWESFASGHAIVERYGKKAMDITDKPTWQRIAHDIAQGMIELIAIMEPDVIVIGGSVGTYFERYGDYLSAALKHYEIPMLNIPPIVKAQRPEEAVVYGCYDLIKQQTNGTTAS